MYINKYLIIGLISAILFNGCSKPEVANNANGYISYTRYLDGNIRSFDIINDSK